MSEFYPLRDRIKYKIPYPIRDACDSVRYWFKPRQKWLTKQIPNHWVDKDWLWELCILEGIKHYVEKDGGLDYYEESLKDPDYPEHQKKFNRELAENYDLIIHRLPQLERKLKSLWEALPHRLLDDINKPMSPEYRKISDGIEEVEGTITALKTKVMIWAVLNRESIWT
jgi:hypothetical protein